MRTENWILVDEDTIEVEVGTVLKTFRGEHVELTGGRPPHKPSSTGRIYVRHMGHERTSEYFPSVCGLKWEARNV